MLRRAPNPPALTSTQLKTVAGFQVDPSSKQWGNILRQFGLLRARPPRSSSNHNNDKPNFCPNVPLPWPGRQTEVLKALLR